MRCLQLFSLLFCLFSVSSAAVNLFDNNRVIETLQNAKEDGKVSEKCQEALQLYIQNILTPTADLWGLKMLDATSKIPVGILSYNLGEFGQFSECLQTQSEDGVIKPKYCLGTISFNSVNNIVQKEQIELQKALHIKEVSRRITNIQTRDDNNNETTSTQLSGISWAICLPSYCSDEDVAEILSDFIDPTYLNCQTVDDLSPPLTAGAIGAIVVLAYFILLLLASTALDLYFKFAHKEPPHELLIAFSMYTNGNKLFRMSKNSTDLTCLNGIRFWSMMWVIIGHVFSVVTSFPLTNFKDVMEFTETLRSMIILSGTLSVDSFFFMAGTLLVYSYFKSKHQGRKFNILQFYIHRYLRLTPALAAVILVTAHLLKYMGTGPEWSNVEESLEKSCRKYWWTALLYVQNYANENMAACVPQSWYLSVDMQLYVLSPLVLIPLWKYPKIGLGIIITSIVTFIVVPFSIAYTEDLPALLSNLATQGKVQDYMKYYYIKTHARAAPWFIGIFFGYILAKIKFQKDYRPLTFNKVLIMLLWAVCLAVGLTCILGGHSTLMGADYDRWGNSLYIGLIRPVWALCLGWVTFASVIGYGGPINWFLSLPIYQVLNRFTYSIYLIHYQLLIVLTLRSKTGIYFDEFNLAYSFWGLTMFCFALSIIWVLAFESPIVVLEKVIFGHSKKESDHQENRNTRHQEKKTGLPGQE